MAKIHGGLQIVPLPPAAMDCIRRTAAYICTVFTTRIPLEDELGDVLEKALHHAGLSAEAAAAQAGVDVAKIRDAIDYRYDLATGELRRLATVLRLNEVGFCAHAQEQYPLPEIGALPFCVWPLRMPYGIGVANAYIVSECDGSRGLLFDVGPSLLALTEVWPRSVKTIDAVFLTHVEGEHAGGLCDVVARFGVDAAYVPAGAKAPCGQALEEGETRRIGPYAVRAFSTPGHAAAHNCYLVSAPAARGSSPLLISGDLIFAGSAGGGYFCHRQLHVHLRRVLESVPTNTVIAPGHGPLTTVENELRFNPFVV
jgi:glyoxylase-like metal-dependent hydrolase (beta-lactamase superfamily II)